MCTLSQNSNTSACLDQHARTNNFETENSIFDNEESPELVNSQTLNNTEILRDCEKSDLCEDPRVILSDIRRKNLNRPIIGHININFLESKFDALKLLIEDILDILVVTETKIDASYPTAQFEINGFGTPFGLDRNKHGGGVMIYVREHLPCKPIQFQNKPNNVEVIFYELTLRKKKVGDCGGLQPSKRINLLFLRSCKQKLRQNNGKL